MPRGHAIDSRKERRTDRDAMLEERGVETRAERTLIAIKKSTSIIPVTPGGEGISGLTWSEMGRSKLKHYPSQLLRGQKL